MAQTVVIDIEARFIDNTSAVGAASRKLDQFSRTIEKTQKAIDRMNGKKVNPSIDVNDNVFLNKIAKAKARAEELGKKKTVMALDFVDRATRKMMQVWAKAKEFARGRFMATLMMNVRSAEMVMNRVRGALQGLVRRAWKITIGLTDRATAPLRNLIGQLKSVAGLAGIAGVGGTVFSAVSQEVTQQNLEAQYATMFSHNKDVLSGVGVSGKQYKAWSKTDEGRAKLLEKGYEAAQSRLDELIEFAGSTPFLRQDIFQADKVLQAYTNGAMNNETDRNLVGNLAALGGRDYASMASVMGRMYVNMAGGHGIGDSLMSLREMGTLTAEAEEKIQSLADKVESGGMTMEDAWKGVREAFSDYDGMMLEMSKKLGNLLTGIQAQVKNQLLAPIGQGISDALSPFLERFKAWRGTEAGTEFLKGFRSAVKEKVTGISNFFLDAVERVAGQWNRVFNSGDFANKSFGEKLRLMWEGLGKDLKEWWTTKGEVKVGGIAKLMGEKMSEYIGKAIVYTLEHLDVAVNAFSSIWSSFIEGAKKVDWNDLFSRAKGAIEELFEMVNWAKVGEGIASAIISAINAVNWAEVLKTVGTIIQGIWTGGGLGGKGLVVAGGAKAFGGIASGALGMAGTVAGIASSSVTVGNALKDRKEKRAQKADAKVEKKMGKGASRASKALEETAAREGSSVSRLGKFGKAMGKLGKRVPGLGAALTLGILGYELLGAEESHAATASEDPRAIPQGTGGFWNKRRMGAVGDAAGGLGGGAVGALVGSAFGPIGTIAGGIIGGFAGGAFGKALVGGGGGNTSRWKGHGRSGEKKTPTHKGGKIRQEVEAETKVKVNKKKTSSAIDKATTKAAKSASKKKVKTKNTVEVEPKAKIKEKGKLTKSVEKKTKNAVGKKPTKATHKAEVTVKAKTKTSDAKKDVKQTAKEALDNKTTKATANATTKVNTKAVKGSLSKGFNMQSWVKGSLPKSVSATVRVNVTKVKGSVGGYTPSSGDNFRGGIIGAGIPHYAEGGFVRGGAQLSMLAEEGTPEAVIPLGKHRRKRGVELWEKAGEYLGVKKYARGGIAGGSEGGSHGGGKPSVNVGGITINVQGGSAQEGLSNNKEKIAQEVAEIINNAISATYENMPASA